MTETTQREQTEKKSDTYIPVGLPFSRTVSKSVIFQDPTTGFGVIYTYRRTGSEAPLKWMMQMDVTNWLGYGPLPHFRNQTGKRDKTRKDTQEDLIFHLGEMDRRALGTYMEIERHWGDVLLKEATEIDRLNYRGEFMALRYGQVLTEIRAAEINNKRVGLSARGLRDYEIMQKIFPEEMAAYLKENLQRGLEAETDSPEQPLPTSKPEEQKPQEFSLMRKIFGGVFLAGMLTTGLSFVYSPSRTTAELGGITALAGYGAFRKENQTT